MLYPLIAMSIFVGSVGFAAQATPEKLTVSRIFADPPLSGSPVKGLKVAPDASRVTYLKGSLEKSETLDLWQYDLSTKTHTPLVETKKLNANERLSAEETARRERMRISDSGIVDYVWSADSKKLSFTLGGRIYILSLETKVITPLPIDASEVTDLKFSPKGSFLSYVKSDNVWVVDFSKVPMQERTLTSGQPGKLRYGVAEFVAQEEMDRRTGYWWSSDESTLAIAEVDESQVLLMKRYEINGDGFDVIEQRYPKAGTPNAKVRLGLFSASGSGSPRWLKLTDATDFYLARVDWNPDSKTLLAQIQTRDQKSLALQLFGKDGKFIRTVFTEADAAWVDLHDDLRLLKEAPQMIWKSPRDGHAHLYLFNTDGTLVRQLTHGSWSVRKIVAINEPKRMIYFQANRETYLDQRLYAVSFDGGEVKSLTPAPGTHNVTMPDGSNWFIDDHSDIKNPNRITITGLDGKILDTLADNRALPGTALYPLGEQLARVEFASMQSQRGYELHYRLIKPSNFIPGKKYPLLLAVYGGPDRPQVRNAWEGRNYLFYSVLAKRGYLILTVDNRGMGPRSTQFLTAIANRLGTPEVEDQVEVLEHVIKKGSVDKNRVGTFGWSYGGYMTLMLMSKHPNLFKAGVSVAPVSDWSLYDTHYTERYMGDPVANKKAYDESNVLTHLQNLKGSLLLMHGMADDNVLFTNSTMVLKSLQERGVLFESTFYPGSKHGIYGKKQQTHVFTTIEDFLVRRL